MKKVLLITYHFPPDNAVGGLRMAKFARNLPSFGWEPSVLTVMDRYREGIDATRLQDVMDLEIIRTIELPSARNIYLRLKAFFLSAVKNKKIDITYLNDSYITKLKADPIAGREGIFQRLKRYFIPLLMVLPDDKRNWVIPAAFRAVLEVRRRGFDCVITSSPPHSTHLIGLIVKKLTNVKWVADFRDPWVDNLCAKSPLIRSALSDRTERWMEKKVVENADRVITTTEAFADIFKKRYDGKPDGSILCIPNGIDTSKFTNKKEVEKYGEFTITYAGTIYEGRTPEPVFKAVAELIKEDRIQGSDIRIKLVGNCRHIGSEETTEVVRRHGLDGVVELSPFIPHNEAISVMRRSHLLLLLAPNQPLAVPAKIYDYFGSGAKILALTEDGATSELIKATDTGVSFTQDNISGIKEYIHGLMTTESRDDIRNSAENYARFNIESLSRRLADELSDISGVRAAVKSRNFGI